MTLYRFYRIIGPGDSEYIGSTIETLNRRFAGHKSKYKCNRTRESSKLIFDLYGIDNCSIELLYELEYNTKREAHEEERRLIEQRKDYTVNIRIPFLSTEEYIQSNRERARKRYQKLAEEKRQWKSDTC